MPKKSNNSEVKIKQDTRILLEIETKNGINGIPKFISLSSSVEEIMDDGVMLIQMPIFKLSNQENNLKKQNAK